MASFYQRTALESYRSQQSPDRLAPQKQSVHYKLADIDMEQCLATWVITGQNARPKVPLSLSIDENVFDKIHRDAEALGIQEEDLVCWLLEKYAQGELTGAYFPGI